MKKSVSLLLILVFCLCFSACGKTELLSPETSETQKSEGVTENISQTGNGGGSEKSEPASREEVSSEPAIPDYIRRWYDRLEGNWFAVDKEGLVCSEYVINGDGKITINNETYTMKLTTQESWEWASIDVLKEDGTKAYDMRIDLRNGGLVEMSFIYQDKNGDYYREDQVEAVELTKDNWLNYFELGEFVGIGFNAFNEYERMFVQPQYRLKEAYLNKLVPEISSGAVECSVKYETRNIEMIPSEKKYIWGDFVKESTPYTYKVTERLAQITAEEKDGKYINGFGFVYASFGLYDLEEDYVGQDQCPTLEEVHRIAGTLYFYTGKE
ncbi:MAG: hypothetical protein IJC85_01615 [Oscillospiraceae bacterium]|nr:hypothetical protein [Oscillospiraceae bacterium]